MNLRFHGIEHAVLYEQKLVTFILFIPRQWFTYPYSTNKYTVLLLCISLQIT